jgi:hypothetical protein
MVEQDQTQIMTHILTEGSITAGFKVYADLMNYHSGVYHHVTGTFEGNHAVRVIGWGVDSGTPYWLVANSWGTSWGLSGFFKMLRGSDECGFEESMSTASINPGGCPAAQCKSSETCCSTATSGWSCCPVANGVCCDDHIHCCPAGTQCDSSGSCQSKDKTSGAETMLKAVLLKSRMH